MRELSESRKFMLAKIYGLKAVHSDFVPSTKFAKIRESAKIPWK